MRASSAVTRRGVNARLTSRRSSSWRGGSMKIIIPKLGSDSGSSATGVFVSMNSSTVPRAELYGLPVERRRVHVGEAAQRVEVVLLVVVERRSSRSRFHTGYGSASMAGVVRVVVGRGKLGAHRSLLRIEWVDVAARSDVCNIRASWAEPPPEGASRGTDQDRMAGLGARRTRRRLRQDPPARVRRGRRAGACSTGPVEFVLHPENGLPQGSAKNATDGFRYLVDEGCIGVAGAYSSDNAIVVRPARERAADPAHQLVRHRTAAG